MLSTAQQMLQDSRTKIELLRMQIVKVTQAREGEREASETDGEHRQFTTPLYYCITLFTSIESLSSKYLRIGQ